MRGVRVKSPPDVARGKNRLTLPLPDDRFEAPRVSDGIVVIDRKPRDALRCRGDEVVRVGRKTGVRVTVG